MKKYNTFLKKLNHKNSQKRLKYFKKIMSLANNNDNIYTSPVCENKVNNHIHTTYSFSPYSPTKAIWKAYKAGLVTAGIMDHDTIAGSHEFIKAGKIAGIATTVGLECRADFSETALKGRKINCPDQKSIAYIALHGIPHQKIDKVQNFLKKYRMIRNERNKKMVKNINDYFEKYDIKINYKKDVIPISEYKNGGTITERHLLFALSLKLIDKFGRGKKLLNILTNDFKEVITPEIEKYLKDENNAYYEYDLLGLLKKDTDYFYVKADKECPDIRDILHLSEKVGAISAYAYLGDIKKTVTGDKKVQKFEDSYLEFLFDKLKELGFKAITYMPSRNTGEQLQKVKSLCEKYNFLQISGEDINSPRQSFVCEDLKQERYNNLIDSTWALIGHETAATNNIKDGMFSEKSIKKYPDLEERIEVFKIIGQSRFKEE